jgi:amino acid adenylation domain-containing protein
LDHCRGRRSSAYLGLLLDELVAKQWEATPDAVALTADGDAWTYDRLWRASAAVAASLRGEGVGPDVVVGVCADRSVLLPVALLGILRAGGAYCPLDPRYPSRRIGTIVERAGIEVVVADPGLAAGIRGAAGGVTALALDEGLITRDVAAEPVSNRSPADLAYVIFTSGSTGEPKGVMIPHQGIVNRLLWMQAELGIESSDIFLQKTPYTFDVSVWEFFLPLISGARLHVADPDAHWDPESVAATIRAESVTIVHFVPSMLKLFLAEPAAVGLPSLKRIVTSGEALPTTMMNATLAAHPQADLYNLYGPTEASVDVTSWRCRRLDDDEPVPIGQPIDNVVAVVTNEDGEALPVGQTGELLLGGVQLARGYIGREDLTRSAFVDDGIGLTDDGRLYRTGDLARWRADGALEYHGRKDGQIKLRGLRVELGEIEVVLRRASGVSDAAVAVRDDLGPGKHLVAYVVPDDAGSPIDAQILRRHLAEVLPAYMIPTFFEPLDALPLSPNGKLDRGKLPRPGGA